MQEPRLPNKSVLPELGIELVVDVLLFVFPYGAEQMNLPHIFWLGFGCWVVGIAIVIRMFWILPVWNSRLTRLEKGLIAAILVALFVAAVYKPVVVAYGKRNVGTEDGTKPISAPPPQPPIPAQKETPNSQQAGKPSGRITQKGHHNIVQNGNNNQANPVTINGNQTTNGDGSPIINGNGNSVSGKP
jgi:hypothetical protein